jgi:hypothetical protein
MPDENRELVHHLPDEVCIRVQATESAAPAELYQQVLDSINSYFPAGQLRPLTRQGVSRGARGQRPPWLGIEDNERYVWHLYYQLGDRRIGFDRRDSDERLRRQERVREVTNRLNMAGRGRIDAPTGRGWQIEGGSPNWLTAALPFSCGSPAALPTSEPRRDVRPRFEFGSRVTRELGGKRGGGSKARIVVAILDTCPARLYPRGNAYLRELIGKLRVSSILPTQYYGVPAGAAVHWDGVLPAWQDEPLDPLPRPEFKMPDHGLFVAGIVNDIAADVELHLVRVLNDFGVGDLFALEQVLRSLPEKLLTPDARLIVNLSLGSSVPLPRRRYCRRWLPESTAARSGEWPDEEANALLDSAHGGLANAIRWLHEQGVLVVAAAGNDALRSYVGEELPPPRYPAYYEPVLAVASALDDGTPAPYSNRGDVLPFGNGITTFGGNVVERGKNEPPLTDEQHSIVGIYSSGRLPGGARNKTGWAHWSGTSFSTPIVTGLAARFWQQDPAQKPTDLMQRIRECGQNIASRREQGNDPDGPLDAPYLEARQVIY